MEDITQLHYIGNQLGVQVELTPKYHTEIAGIGVDFSWESEIGWYNRNPLYCKKPKSSFKILVKEVTSWYMLTLEKYTICSVIHGYISTLSTCWIMG